MRAVQRVRVKAWLAAVDTRWGRRSGRGGWLVGILAEKDRPVQVVSGVKKCNYW